MTETPFPSIIAENRVVDVQRVPSKWDEVPMAVVLMRNTCRPSDRAFEVCNAGLRGGTWLGFETAHSMSETVARQEFNQRIDDFNRKASFHMEYCQNCTTTYHRTLETEPKHLAPLRALRLRGSRRLPALTDVSRETSMKGHTIMSNTHSVWVSNTSPEWLARNGGNPAMVLGQADHYNANFMANRLQLLVPGLEVAVKDDHGNFVPIVPEEDAYFELIEKPRKTALGLFPE